MKIILLSSFMLWLFVNCYSQNDTFKKKDTTNRILKSLKFNSWEEKIKYPPQFPNYKYDFKKVSLYTLYPDSVNTKGMIFDFYTGKYLEYNPLRRYNLFLNANFSEALKSLILLTH